MPPRRNVRTGGFEGIERKFFDTFVTATALTAPTNMAGAEIFPEADIEKALNTMIAGTGESDRIGRKINMKSINIRGIVNIPADATAPTASTPTVFIALILDMQTNATMYSSEDVYKNIGASALLATSPFRELENVRRFKVLKTVRMPLNLVAIAHDGTNLEMSGTNTPFEFYVDLKSIQVNYIADGQAGEIAMIADNSLHILATVDDVGYVPTISFNSRLRFTG